MTIGRLKIFFVSLLFVILIFEMMVRGFKLFPNYGYPDGMYVADSLLGYRLQANFSGKFIGPEFQTAIKTNSVGLEDVEFGKKEIGEYRILALGDSFTWGAYGVRPQENFLKVLEKELNAKYPQHLIRVINSGVPGYGTAQELLYLKSRGIELLPDMIIVNFCVENDFFENAAIRKLGVNARGQLTLNSVGSWRATLLEYSHAYRFIDRGMGSLVARLAPEKFIFNQQPWPAAKELFTHSEDPHFEQAKTETLKALEDLRRFCEDSKISLVIVLIPSKYQVDRHLQKIFITKAKLDKTNVDFTKPQRIISAWAFDHHVVVIDLLPGLKEKNKNNDFYWPLNAHFNTAGNQHVGQILFKELNTLISFKQ